MEYGIGDSIMNIEKAGELLKYVELNNRQYDKLAGFLKKLNHIQSRYDLVELQADIIRELDYSKFLVEETQRLLDDASGN